MYKIITPATAEPVNVEDAKDHLRVDGSDEDMLITALIPTAREYAEHYTGRALARQTVEQVLPAFPAEEIALDLGPAASVTFIKYTDSNGDEQTLGSDQYLLNTYGSAKTIERAYGVTWPATRGPNAVRVRYETGYEDAPAAAISAILLLVAHLFENRQDVSALKLASIPMGATELLNTIKGWGR